MPPSEATSTIALRAAASTAAPAKSIFGRPRGPAAGSVAPITASATSPIGRLTKKIQRQLKLSTINPPSSGPAMLAMPKTAPNSP